MLGVITTSSGRSFQSLLTRSPKKLAHNSSRLRHRCQVFVDSANPEGVKLFCKVRLNLVILCQSKFSEFFPQIQVKTTKKGLCYILALFQSGFSCLHLDFAN